jgi:hypothetical protein
LAVEAAIPRFGDASPGALKSATAKYWFSREKARTSTSACCGSRPHPPARRDSFEKPTIITAAALSYIFDARSPDICRLKRVILTDARISPTPTVPRPRVTGNAIIAAF